MDPRRSVTPGRRAVGRARLLVPAIALGAALAVAGPATALAPQHSHPATAPDLGANVVVFTPSTPLADIQATLDALATEQVDAEMTTARHAVLFAPGTYGTAETPLQFTMGYYTEVAGLGASPTDVVINGKVEVYNRCLSDDPASPNCLALVNFWRTLSNLTLNINAAGQDGCRSTADFWAVSQAVSMRRLNITGANLSLMDYCTAGPQYASGGFIADSRLPFVVSGSQQQWLIRNSEIAGWSNGVWNQVFSGVVGAPTDATFPDPPYTTLATTPLSREKPYLFLDASGRWNVRVPSAAAQTSGITWGAGMTAGRTVPLSDFFIADPSDSVQTINSQLAHGKNLLFTPGIYSIGKSITVKRADTVVLGLGHATLTSARGAVPLTIEDQPGIVVAGLTIDAGETMSPALMQVGTQGGHHSHHSDRRWWSNGRVDPITLSDVYFRVGGPHIGRTGVALEINADDVLIDHTWVWRADHGIEGFTQGVNGDTDRWNTNTARNGVVVNGDDVTATGLFVEHFQQYSTLWNGERGRVVFYQNELAYDPPTQADWTQPNGTLGWAGYAVGPRVKTHELWGAGVYVFNQNNPAIVTDMGFEVPSRPGIKLHHVLTVNLSAGTIRHVVNTTGAQVDNTNTGTPSFLVSFP